MDDLQSVLGQFVRVRVEMIQNTREFVVPFEDFDEGGLELEEQSQHFESERRDGLLLVQESLNRRQQQLVDQIHYILSCRLQDNGVINTLLWQIEPHQINNKLHAPKLQIRRVGLCDYFVQQQREYLVRDVVLQAVS